MRKCVSLLSRITKVLKQFICASILVSFCVLLSSGNRKKLTMECDSCQPEGAKKVNFPKKSSVVEVFDKNNYFIMNIDLVNMLSVPLPFWNATQEIMMFLHIGKSGGNSFSSALRNSQFTKLGCNMKCSMFPGYQRECPDIKTMLCLGHFDWSHIDHVQKEGYQVAPVVLFRNPVDRLVSHFYYGKHSIFNRKKRFRNQTLSEFLNDEISLKESYNIWHDGQVSQQQHQFELFTCGYTCHEMNLCCFLSRVLPSGWQVFTLNTGSQVTYPQKKRKGEKCYHWTWPTCWGQLSKISTDAPGLVYWRELKTVWKCLSSKLG